MFANLLFTAYQPEIRGNNEAVRLLFVLVVLIQTIAVISFRRPDSKISSRVYDQITELKQGD